MDEPTDRFAIEIGAGTVAHTIGTNADQSEMDSRFSLGIEDPKEIMCSRGSRYPHPRHVSLSEFAAHHDISKAGFEGGASDEIYSYCWSSTCEAVGEEQDADDLSEQIGTVEYRPRWKQKGRVREGWYDIVVRPETTMAELDGLACRSSTLDGFHLRMYSPGDKYLDSSLNVLPDRQYEEVGDRTYTKAGKVAITNVVERTRLREGNRLSLVYNFGTPSHYYCIAEDVYEPDETDEALDDDVITSTDTTAIVKQKRP